METSTIMVRHFKEIHGILQGDGLYANNILQRIWTVFFFVFSERYDLRYVLILNWIFVESSVVS